MDGQVVQAAVNPFLFGAARLARLIDLAESRGDRLAVATLETEAGLGYADRFSAGAQDDRPIVDDGFLWSMALDGGNAYRARLAEEIMPWDLEEKAVGMGIVPHPELIGCPLCPDVADRSRNAAGIIRWERAHDPSLRLDPIRWHVTAWVMAG